MKLKIQGRVHLGKLRITVQTQVRLKWEDKFKVFVNKVCKIFKPWTLIALLRRSETPAGHFSH